MAKKPLHTMTASTDAQRAALTSPLRLEILGLFTSGDDLSISDMARLMGRPAGSLYHHVGLLEKAGLLIRSGTRPKGKRYEALFRPVAERIAMQAESDSESQLSQVVKTLASAFRMAERDLEAAIHDGVARTEGPGRNFFATRMHMRATPDLRAAINRHLEAIEKLMARDAAGEFPPTPDDEYLSLTLALLPLKGRKIEKDD